MMMFASPAEIPTELRDKKSLLLSWLQTFSEGSGSYHKIRRHGAHIKTEGPALLSSGDSVCLKNKRCWNHLVGTSGQSSGKDFMPLVHSRASDAEGVSSIAGWATRIRMPQCTAKK